MSLQLPTNFRNDIQGRDTNLVPLVVIGNLDVGTSLEDWIFLSTNNISLNNNHNYYIQNPDINNTKNFKPILLNIPSLKESIDIEKRNYKISSVNIDISNLPYDGKRFSELISSDNSLINVECRIYWASPSVENFITRDFEDYEELFTDADAFQVYFGNIRRYTHDDEKVRLVVEDRSQAKLHIPLPTANLGTGYEVPDKYKNKPIPMVYGHVDRSPCVIKSFNSEYTLFADNIPISGLAYSTFIYADYYGSFTTSPIMMFIDDKYLYIEEKIKYLYDYLYDKPYFLNAEDTQLLLSSETNITQWENLNNYFPLSDNFLLDQNIQQGLIATNPVRIYTKSEGDVTEDNLFDIIDYDPTTTFSGGGTLSPSNHHLGDNGEVSGFPENFKTFQQWYFEMPDYLAARPLGLLINGVNIPIPSIEFIDDPSIADPIPASPVMIITENVLSSEEQQLFIDEGTGTGYDLGFKFYSVYDVEGVNLSSIFKLQTVETQSGNQGSEAFRYSIFYDTDVETVTTSIPYARITASYPAFVLSWGVYTSLVAPEGSWYIQSIFSFRIEEALMLFSADVKGGIKKDFYANVIGRAVPNIWDSPNLPETINHIVTNELGQTATDSPESNYNGWKYDFTVDKSINSKKLIEGIASASPYIPRFNNMGEFKYSVIEEDYNSGQLIEEQDVVDFSFSRTPIENVYTKIVFKYNWDYARKEFNSSVDASTALIGDYKPEYYGFPPAGDEAEHSESTLIIDDDRGKYIRDEFTAKAFADWFLTWSANQHLKIKVKLPLKYMKLEIGDIVKFDEVVGGVKPYGIDYKYEVEVNKQAALPYFMITSTNKSVEFCELECIQMHRLYDSGDNPYVGGCGDETACNYKPDATQNANCVYISDYCTTDDFGICPPGYCEEGVNCIEDCPAVDGDGDGDGDGDDECAIVDCAGVCGGDAVVDECGNCGGDGCHASTIAGEPWYEGCGTMMLGANGISGPLCDCDGNVEDCAGVCGGNGSVQGFSLFGTWYECDCGAGAPIECPNGSVVCPPNVCEEEDDYPTMPAAPELVLFEITSNSTGVNNSGSNHADWKGNPSGNTRKWTWDNSTVINAELGYGEFIPDTEELGDAFQPAPDGLWYPAPGFNDDSSYAYYIDNMKLKFSLEEADAGEPHKITDIKINAELGRFIDGNWVRHQGTELVGGTPGDNGGWENLDGSRGDVAFGPRAQTWEPLDEQGYNWGHSFWGHWEPVADCEDGEILNCNSSTNIAENEFRFVDYVNNESYMDGLLLYFHRNYTRWLMDTQQPDYEQNPEVVGGVNFALRFEIKFKTNHHFATPEEAYEFTSYKYVEISLFKCPGGPGSGDVNGDGFWNDLDVTMLTNCVMGGYCADLGTEGYTFGYPCAADMSGDNNYNQLDIVQLQNCILCGSCPDCPE